MSRAKFFGTKGSKVFSVGAMLMVALCLCMFSAGCAAPAKQTKIHLQMSKGLPERFFTDSKIDIDDSKNVSYTFTSNLDDPFPLQAGGTMDLNPSFESVLKYYMNSKYAIAGSSGGDYHVDIILETCTYKGEMAGSETAQGSTHSLSGSATTTVTTYYIKITSEITAKARVTIGGKVSERQIMAMGEYTGDYTDVGTVTRSFDLTVRSVISRIDRFLNSTIGASSGAGGSSDSSGSDAE